MTRLIGIVPDQRQANDLVDSLKKAGFDRGDMIISDMNKSFKPQTGWADTIMLKTERESLMEREPYTDFLLEEADQGIVVAVEAPKHEAARIRELMEQSGATKIVQD